MRPINRKLSHRAQTLRHECCECAYTTVKGGRVIPVADICHVIPPSYFAGSAKANIGSFISTLITDINSHVTQHIVNISLLYAYTRSQNEAG